MRAAHWSAAVAAWIFIHAVTAAVVLGVLVPRVSGSTPYTILTGSMRPELPPGTLVVVRPHDVDDIASGDVITYQLESGRPEVVTHRVVAVSVNLRGDKLFRTQGDANDVQDEKPVRAVQVKGKFWYDVPYLGYVNNAINGTERSIAMIVVVSGLLLYSVIMFSSALRHRAHRSGKHLTDDAS